MAPLITPGDLEHTDTTAQKPRTLESFTKQPGVIPTYFVSKHSDHKASIEDACLDSRIRFLPGKHVGVSHEVASLHEVLVAAAHKVNHIRWGLV